MYATKSSFHIVTDFFPHILVLKIIKRKTLTKLHKLILFVNDYLIYATKFKLYKK